MPSLPDFLSHILQDKNPDIPMATVIAVAVHVFVIFGVSFNADVLPNEMAQEVATVLSDNKEKNKEARFVANASQEGGGEVRQQLRQETTMISPDVSDDMEETQDIINLQKQSRQEAYQENYLRTTLSVRYVNNQNDNNTKKIKTIWSPKKNVFVKKFVHLKLNCLKNSKFFHPNPTFTRLIAMQPHMGLRQDIWKIFVAMLSVSPINIILMKHVAIISWAMFV